MFKLLETKCTRYTNNQICALVKESVEIVKSDQQNVVSIRILGLTMLSRHKITKRGQ